MKTLNQTETFLESEIAKSLKYFEGKIDKYFMMFYIGYMKIK